MKRLFFILQIIGLFLLTSCEKEALFLFKKQPKPTDPVSCEKIYKPVCGSDGVTYSNECFAKAAGVTIVNDGSCPINQNPGDITCAAYFESWFYIPETGNCEKRGYSGCGPLSDGFNTQEECEECKSCKR